MKVPLHYIKECPRWFWGAAGALVVALVLLLVSAPSKPTIVEVPASAAEAMTDFTLNQQETIFSIPTITDNMGTPTSTGGDVAADKITLTDDVSAASLLAFKSGISETLRTNYAAGTLPDTPDAQSVYRILYQSAPYLTLEEVRSMLAPKMANAQSITEAELIAATQLAITSVIENKLFDFTGDVDTEYPNVKPLYDYYMSIAQTASAAPITFSIDTTMAMWTSGMHYGPVKILASAPDYASNVMFELQISSPAGAQQSIAFTSATNERITSIGVKQPFYITVDESSPLLDEESDLTISAIAGKAVSHGGSALCLVPKAVPSFSEEDSEIMALRGPVPAQSLFSAYSLRGMLALDVIIRLSPVLLK